MADRPASASCPWASDFADPSALIFDEERLLRIDVTMSPADWTWLVQNGDTEEYRRATVTICDQTRANSGIRFRKPPGALMFKPYVKNNMLIEINRFNAGNEALWGVTHVNIEYESDFNLVSEPLAWRQFNAAGLDVSRANNARLYVNNQYIGVFSNIERVDKRYVKRRFGDDQGNLYKHTYCSGLFTWKGSDPRPYQYPDAGPFDDDTYCYEKKTNEQDPDISDMIRLIDVLNNTPPARLERELSRVFDVARWLRIVAANQILANPDSGNAGGNNLYTYHAASPDRLVPIPWDLDVGYWAEDFECNKPFDFVSYNLFFVRCHRDLPMFTKVIAEGPWRSRYLAAVRDVLLQGFSPEGTIAELESIYRLIRPALAEDPNRNGSDAMLEAKLARLKDRIFLRYDAVRKQLLGSGISIP